MIFRDKRVALVGPAPIETDQRAVIDSCDLVVRLNQALPVPSHVAAVTTDRCDVLYTWRKVKPAPCWEELQQIRLKTDALFQDDFQGWSHRGAYAALKQKIALIEPEHFYGLSERVGCRANTGLCAMSEIAAHRPSLLYITGITFYRGKRAYYPGYTNKELELMIANLEGNVGKHRQEPQLLYFAREIYPLPFVQCSPELDRIVKSIDR